MSTQSCVSGRKLEAPIDHYEAIFQARLERALKDPLNISEEEVTVCANVIRALRELADLRNAHRDLLIHDEGREVWR